MKPVGVQRQLCCHCVISLPYEWFMIERILVTDLFVFTYTKQESISLTMRNSSPCYIVALGKEMVSKSFIFHKVFKILGCFGF